MKEFIDKFAEKVMTTKESFDVKRDNGKAVTFVQRQCGDASNFCMVTGITIFCTR